MAITPVNIVDSGPNHITYTIGEDANAANVVQRDVLADLTAQSVGAGFPLFDVLNNGGVAFGNQAAAIVAFDDNVDLIVHHRAQSAGDACIPTLTPNVSGGAPGNFRLDLGSAKGAAGDTATYVLTVQHRHSIIR